MRKEAPLSEFKRKDGMISLEHCQERISYVDCILLFSTSRVYRGRYQKINSFEKFVFNQAGKVQNSSEFFLFIFHRSLRCGRERNVNTMHRL